MGRVLLRRVLLLIPVLIVVGTVAFLLAHITPGDPAAFMLGPDASPVDVDRLRTALGLDRPLPVQYAQWLYRAAQGDLGNSIFLHKPVLVAIAERLEPTVMLTGLAVLMAVSIGIPAGVAAAVRHRSWVDRAVMFLATLGVSIPSFWLGLGLILLVGVNLHWLPVAGYASVAQTGLGALRYLLLPAFSLGLIEAALIARMARSSMLDILHQDFIRTARAKGLSERLVIFRHAIRGAAIPIITVIGNTMAVLLGGAIVTETVFNIPGIGRLVIQSVLRRDYPLMQGVVLFVAVVYVLINLIVDLMYAKADPRIRYG